MQDTRDRTADLTREELQRYGRHIIMPEVGLEGQRKLKRAAVLIIGAGGLGSPIALYLAAAGVGKLGLVDYDLVEVSNLQRQIVHGTHDVGRPKLESARDRVRDVNPNVTIELHNLRISSQNALDLLESYDIIVDGTDNFPTRYLVNDACVLLGKPNVYGSIFRFEGQVSVFAADRGPCYRCLYPAPPPPGMVPTCAEGGVFGVLPGVIGSMQAAETIKLILGEGTPLIGRLILFDALSMNFREIRLRKDPRCPVCGPQRSIHSLIDYEEFCGMKPEPAVPMDQPDISPEELKQRMDRGERPFLLDVREPQEYQVANLNAHLIPLGQLPQRMNELDPAQEIIVHCKTGNRSARAVSALRKAGFHNVRNLAGGIDAWSQRIDPTVPRY